LVEKIKNIHHFTIRMADVPEQSLLPAVKAVAKGNASLLRVL
jgi:hypothetical protein